MKLHKIAQISTVWIDSSCRKVYRLNSDAKKCHWIDNDNCHV